MKECESVTMIMTLCLNVKVEEDIVNQQKTVALRRMS